MTRLSNPMTQTPLSRTMLVDCADRLTLFSHDIRLQVIVELLNRGGVTVAELLRTIDVEQNLLSHHLGIMRKAGLLVARREGKHIRYALASGLLTDDRAIDLGCCKVQLSPPTNS